MALAAAALAPNLIVALLAMGLVGVTSVAFLSMSNSTLQLAAEPHMRGRVMALWAVAFLGSTPIGGPDRRRGERALRRPRRAGPRRGAPAWSRRAWARWCCAGLRYRRAG